MSSDLIVGSAALGFGLFTTWIRIRRPAWFWKLEKMKELYGPRAGYALHFVGYSLVPMAIGVHFLLKGFGIAEE